MQILILGPIWQASDSVSPRTTESACRPFFEICTRTFDTSTGKETLAVAARITPEYVDSFREALRRPQNFFKHGDRDPENILEFRPGSAGVIIWAACEKYCELTKEELLETAAFHRWILIQNPGLLLAPYRQQVERLGLSTDFTENMRPQFFEQFSVAYARSSRKTFA